MGWEAGACETSLIRLSFQGQPGPLPGPALRSAREAFVPDVVPAGNTDRCSSRALIALGQRCLPGGFLVWGGLL